MQPSELRRGPDCAAQIDLRMIDGIIRAVNPDAVCDKRRAVGDPVFEYQLVFDNVSRIADRDRIAQNFALDRERLIDAFDYADRIGNDLERQGVGVLYIVDVASFGVVYGVVERCKVRDVGRCRLVRFQVVFDHDGLAGI